MKISWTDDLVCGHDIIDEEHKDMLIKVNQFYDAFNSGKAGTKEVVTIINDFIAYLKEHLINEERLMEKHHYSHMNSHIKAHQDIVDKLTNIYENIQKTGVTKEACENMYNFSVDWYRHHILIYDKNLATFLIRVKKREDAIARGDIKPSDFLFE